MVENSSFKGKIALVTGASSGIGAAIARALAAQGILVLLLARRAERLEALACQIHAAGGAAEVFPADISIEAEREHIFKHVMTRYGRLDVLVNNAGMGYYGYAAEMPWQTASEILAVNIAAVVHLTVLFLPEMKARGRGHVINISSIAGKLPNQGIAVYSGSKSFLDSFSTALYREMKGSGVHISTLRPGPVTTEFFDTAQDRSHGNRRTPGELFAIPPERVAHTLVGLLHRPRRTAYVPGYLVISPLLEMLFGWAIDLVGPVLLKRKLSSPGKGIK